MITALTIVYVLGADEWRELAPGGKTKEPKTRLPINVRGEDGTVTSVEVPPEVSGGRTKLAVGATSHSDPSYGLGEESPALHPEWRELAHRGMTEAPKMLIFVRDQRDVLPVKVSSEASVQDLKIAAQSAGVALHGCMLTFRGVQLLDDSALLADIGVCSESEVDVSVLPEIPPILWNREALNDLNPIFEAEIRIDSGKDMGQIIRLFVQWNCISMKKDLRYVSSYRKGRPFPVELTVMCTHKTGEWRPFPSGWDHFLYECNVEEQQSVRKYLEGKNINIVKERWHRQWRYIEVDMSSHVYEKDNKLQIDDLSKAKLKGEFYPEYPERYSVEWSVTLKSVVQPQQSELEAFMSARPALILKQKIRQLGLKHFEQVLAEEEYDLEKLVGVEPGELMRLGIAEDPAHELIAYCRVMPQMMEVSQGRATAAVDVTSHSDPNAGVSTEVRALSPAGGASAAAGAGPIPDTVEGVLRHLGLFDDCIGLVNAEGYEFRDLPIAEPEDLGELGFSTEQARRLVTYFRPLHPAYAT